MKYVYVVNEFQAKGRSAEIIRKLEETSRRFGRDFEIRVHKTPEEARGLREAYRDTEHVITAVGGDGSINHVLNDLVGTRNVLSLLPCGTGNDFDHAMSQDLASGVREADIVRINERHFINVACFGIDADIANDDGLVHSRLIPASLRFDASILYHFLSYGGGRPLKVECNGETYEQEFMTVVVANSQYYGGGYRVSPGSRIDDGVMEVYLADGLGKVGMARLFLSMKDGGHLMHPSVTALQTNRIVVTSPCPLNANIDGEPLYDDRFEMELVPRGIRLEYDRDFVAAFMS